MIEYYGINLKKEEKTNIFIYKSHMKKIVRITEGDIKRMVKRILSEMPLGVPDNITEVANQIYNIILVRFPSENDLRSNNTTYETTIYGDFHVKDLFFDTVKIGLEMNTALDPNFDPAIIGATVKGTAKIIDDKMHRLTDEVLDIIIRFAVGTEWNLGTIMDLIKRERTSIESMLAHEIMHKYDHFKEPITHAGPAADYNAYQKLGIDNVDPINHFMHLLYFIAETEERTRPSEFYSQLKINKVTKQEFKKFFDESDMISKLRECRDYSFTKLVSDMHDNMDGINEFLKVVNNSGQLNKPIDLNASDISKINETLNLVWIMFTNLTGSIFADILRSNINPFRAMFDPESTDREMAKKQGYLDEFLKRVRKYKNYRDFFENEIKRLNFAGEKTIKKLSNLYAMVENDKNSIVNWDLHQKINDTAGKTREKLQELLSDEPPKIVRKKN